MRGTMRLAAAVALLAFAGCQSTGSSSGGGGSAPAAAGDPDLKGCWSFDEGSGAVAKNSAGPNDGQVPAGLKWVDGKKGKALLFNGKDFVVIKNAPCFNAPQYTIAAWTKLKHTGDYQYIAWKGGPAFPEEKTCRRLDLWVETDGAVNGILHDKDGGENRVAGTKDVADDTWHHVALTYCGKVATLYIDGKKEAEEKPPALATCDHDLWIGARPEGVCATGIIDEVRFYTRALTAAEIAALAGK
jgi:hypothetical protein